MRKQKILILLALSIIIIATFNFASALSLTNMQTSPSQVEPGKQISLSFDVKNTANDDISDVSVSLLLNGYIAQNYNYAAVPFSPVDSSIVTFDEINEDKSKSIDFDLQADSDAKSGTYKIPVQISYKIGNSNQTITEIGVVSVVVNAKPSLSVSSDSSGLIKNQKNELTIQITNLGLGDANFMNVKVSNIGNAQITGASDFYIGTISRDDFDTIKLSIFVNENAGNLISIPLTISYKDSVNKDYTNIETLTIKAYARQEAISLGLIQKSNTGLYAGIIILLIIIYIIYRIIKSYLKRRKKKLEGE